MSLSVPTTDTVRSEWVRNVAKSVNTLLAGREYPFERLTSAPANPGEGRGYYDLTLHKARIWDGSVWQNLW